MGPGSKNEWTNLLSKLAENDGADSQQGNGDEDVGGDACLQPGGSYYLQHGSSVSGAPRLQKREKDAEKHGFRVLNPSITETWPSTSEGALKAADGTRLSRDHWNK